MGAGGSSVERRKGRKGQEKKQKKPGKKKGITFRTLPESVGFHAEGGAETLFIV